MKKWLQLTAHPSFKRLSGEAFWVATGVGLSTLGTLAGVRLLTSVMSPGEYGRLALAVSLSLGMVYSLGVGGGEGVIRYFPIAQKDGAAEWYWQALRRCFRGVLLLTVVLAFVLGGTVFLLGFEAERILFWTMTVLFGGALTIHTLAFSLHTGARNRKNVSAHQCLYEWGRFLAAFGLLLVWKNHAGVVMTGFLFAVTGVIFSEWYWAKKLILSGWSREPGAVDRTADFYRYFRPMAVAGLLFWLQMFADRWALKTFCSLEEVGIYFALYQISYSPMIHVSKFLAGFLGPVLYGKSGDGSDCEQSRQTLVINERVSMILLGAIFAGFAVALWIGRPVCALLVDSGYSSGFWAFPWILLSGGIYAVAQQLLLSVYSGTDTRVMIPVRAISAFLSCLFYLGGAWRLGFAGVVFGGLAFAVVFFGITLYVHLRRKSRLNG